MSAIEKQQKILSVKTRKRIQKEYPEMYDRFEELEGPEICDKSDFQKEDCIVCPKESFREIMWKRKGHPNSVSQVRCCGEEACALDASVLGAVSQLQH